MDTTVRTLESVDNHQYSSLLDSAFPVPTGQKFFDDFPIWETDTFLYGAFSGSKLAGGAGLRIAGLNTDAKTRVGIIGGVAVDSGFRNQGLASKLVSEILARATKEKLAAVFLWGAEASLYGRLGFELCGYQARLPVAPLAAEISNKKIVQGFDAKVFELLRTQRTHGLAIENQDIGWITKHKNVRWLRTEKAYLAFNRGIDLHGIIHEWGGNIEDLRALFTEGNKLHPGLEIISPTILLPTLTTRPDLALVERLCLARILDPVALVKSFWPSCNLIATNTDGSWQIQIADQVFTNVSDGNLTLALLGPSDGSALSSAFPQKLPLWFWGLDSA